MRTAALRRELPDVFRGSEARKAGLITSGQLRGSAVRRLFQDVYARAEIPVTHELRCRAAALLVPAAAVLTGRSAATVLGVELAKPHDPVEFVVPENDRFGPIRGIHVRRTEIKKTESRHWSSCRIARPARIALDLLLRLSPRTVSWARRLRTGVPDLDMFLRAKLVRKKDLIAMLAQRRNRGIRLAREAVRMADIRAESKPESELRVIMVRGGLKPIPQYVVRAKGKLLGRLDLAVTETKTAVEYDGRWHNSPEQIEFDRKRRSQIIAEGWRFVIVDADLLATDYEEILRKIRQHTKDN